MKYIFLTFFFMVSYYLHLPGLSIYIYDFFFILTFFYLISKKEMIDLSDLLFLFLFLFISIGMALYSLIYLSHNFREAEFFARIYRYSFILLLPFLFSELGRSFSQRKIAYIFFVCAMIPVVYNNFMLITISEYVMVFGRASSYLENPNTFGAYMCTVVMPMLVIVYKLGFDRRMLLLALVFSLFSLVYIGSNSYWLLSIFSLISSYLILYSFEFNVKRLITFLFLFVLLCFLLLTNLDYLLASEIAGLKRTAKLITLVFDGGNINELGSGRFRQEIERYSWILILENYLILGTALGQSPALLNDYLNANVTAHNAFVVSILENGIFGFIVFYSFFVFYSFKIQKDIHISQLQKKIVYVAFFSYLLACIATPNVYLPFTLMTMVFAFTQLKALKE